MNSPSDVDAARVDRLEVPFNGGAPQGLFGHAMDHGWIPHKPETWRFRFASLREPLVMKRWNQRKSGLPEFSDIPLEAGARVKIVMVSRFGDVGITDDLTAENGYHARIALDALCEFSDEA